MGSHELPHAPSAASWSFRAGACVPAGSQVACGVRPAHRSPCVCPPALSRGPELARSSLQNSRGPLRHPAPRVCSPARCQEPQGLCPPPPRPPGPPSARPARGPGVRPLPPSLAEAGGGARPGLQRGPGAAASATCHRPGRPLLPRPRPLPQQGPPAGFGADGQQASTRPAAVTLLVGTERRRLKMVRMSCLLGSPMVTTEARRRRPGQPGRTKQERLPPPGDRRRPRGAGLSVTARPRPQAPAPCPAHNRSSRAALFSRPRSAAPLAPPARAPPRRCPRVRRSLGRLLPVAVCSGPSEAKLGADGFGSRALALGTRRHSGWWIATSTDGRLRAWPRSSHLVLVRAQNQSLQVAEEET